ncbi:MAG: class I SAM-dependent methyltransferase [Verrucomicrobiae bacterium]|nr:class I SAM-dependent methyltransferase [Verrucomicrobiae bacterium]
MADSLVSHFSPKSAVDVGCGTGVLLEALRDREIGILGIEKAESALRYCAERKLEVLPLDITRPEEAGQLPRSFDIATSFEVGHQISPESSSPYVAFLTRLSNLVVFSSDPGGDDRLPLNPKPPSYWIQLFAEHGFTFDEAESKTLKRKWEEGAVAHWFSRFPMVFRRMSEIVFLVSGLPCPF